DQRKGRRTSMNLINVGYNRDLLFWDGRSSSLEDQVTGPVEDPNELGHDWPSIEELLRSDRKSTRLNSIHVSISYAVFCLKQNNWNGSAVKRAWDENRIVPRDMITAISKDEPTGGIAHA